MPPVQIMAPNIEPEDWKVSGISRTYPSYRKYQPITGERYGYKSESKPLRAII